MNERNSRHTARRMVSVLLVSVLVGCGKDEEPTSQDNNASQAEDMGADAPVDTDAAGEVDMGEDMPTENNTSPNTTTMEDMPEDMPVACEPITACPADTCGMISDGCDGTLDCGVCECEGGRPTEETCGECALGVNVCDAQGEVTCVMPELPEGMKLSCDTGILYVDANDAGLDQGTRQDPYTSLQAAFDAVRPPVSLIVVREGTYPLEQVRVPDGLSVVGGYGSGWVWQPEARTLLAVDGSSEALASNIGVIFQDLTRPALWANLELDMFDSPFGTSSSSNFGVLVRNVSSTLRLARVTVQAGEATSGEDGANGQPGSAGADGGSSYSTTVGASPTATGKSVSSSCGSQGGDGGLGAKVDLPAEPGVGFVNGSAEGGAAGIEGGTSLTTDGQDGYPGISGEDGFDGEHGSGEVTFAGGAWEHDGDGRDGVVGNPGQSGGGGGGGAFVTYLAQANATVEFAGGSGGAGGNGGCPGTPGEGGTLGGSSVGLVVINAPNLELIASTFLAGNAADGGDGGEGGPGGPGGEGGKGTYLVEYNGMTYPHPNPGGDGGDGHPGGAGGDGGAGAGGHSYGAICDAPLSRVDDATRFQALRAGRGGRAPDNSRAPDGQSMDQRSCK